MAIAHKEAEGAPKPERRPKVSVVVATFNQRDYLAECLDSILAQDFDDFDIVVADDGSSDGSQDLLRSYADAHASRLILCLSDVNRGITANCNAALDAARGDYIAWIGGDDLMLPGKLRKQVARFEADPGLALCYHDLEAFDSVTGERLYLFSERNTPREGGLAAAIRYGCFNGASATMVRRAAVPAAGFDIRVPEASDWLFWVETLSGGGRIAYLDEVLGRYRRHDNNVTSSPDRVLGLIEDHIVSTSIILRKFPGHSSAALHALARNFVALGRRRKNGRWPLFIAGGCLLMIATLAAPFGSARAHRTD